MLEVTTVGIHIILPLALLAWMFSAPLQSRLGFGLHGAASLLVLLAIALTAVWIIPPWWAPRVYIALWLLALLFRGSLLWSPDLNLPRKAVEYLGLAILLPLGIGAVYLTGQAWAGREPPPLKRTLFSNQKEVSNAEIQQAEKDLEIHRRV